jgi:RNA polymerase sigma-70 factor (ECF subfamily)
VSHASASEHDLVRRARTGDQDAFAQLVAMHAETVYRALRRFGLDPAEADEVSQEVFVRAWRGLGSFQERSRVSTWLYRIAFNEAQRQLGRRKPAPAGAEADPGDRFASVAESAHLGPEAQTLDRELDSALAQALDRLPEDWRAAVVLRDVEGLSTAEAAEIAGVGEAAFKSRLHRGRMQLRALLEPYLMLEES